MREWEEDANPWVVKGVTRTFENAWFRIDSHEVVHPGGAEGVYSVIRMRRLAVGVLPIDGAGFVQMVGQWRFPLARYSWEIPEGGAEAGESAETCARRELEEEAGLIAGRLAPILQMDLSNSSTDEQAVVFLATDLSETAKRPEATEVFKHRRAHFREVLERVALGRIRDSLTVAAVLRAHHMAVTGEIPARLAEAMLGEGGG
ncbi:MAG: NUDIX hydrolase [Hyphomonadaceae bacterium]|nr:NUDIX hydrolase [Hyphomonadaceae bacterium]